ncbi:MAG: class I SAM-dependent methyltransferase [Deltaproteobacteria bacterium]|nr:class I SAM-dependent methyltransferase [Deltaproteobacteria bacterium]
MEKIWKAPISEGTERKIMGLITTREGSRLLDFGAGYGRYLKMFSNHFRSENLYGAEIDEEAIKEIRKQGFNCYKPDYDKAEIPYEDNFFDYIFCSNVVEHIPRRYYLKYLEEFYRVLKHSGRLIIGTPNYPVKRLYDLKKAFDTKMFRYYFFDDPTHVNKLSIKQLERDLREVFPVVKLEPTYIFFENNIGWIKRNREKLRLIGDKISGYCDKE